jgi:hypothetical protein
MSDHDIEEVKNHAAKIVSDRLEISDKTRVKVSIGTAAAICFTIIGATWGASWAVGSYLNDLKDGQKQMETTLAYMVPQSQLTSFAHALDAANRDIPPHGLNVPEPEQFRPGMRTYPAATVPAAAPAPAPGN